MMSQTDNQPPDVAGQEPAGKRRRKSLQPREIHHHHYHHDRERKPREIDVSGDPYEVVQGRVNARKTRKALIAFAVAPLAGAGAWVFGLIPAFVLIATGMPIVAGLFFYFVKDFTEADYYQVQGSRFVGGKHRCISCGHGGIWRHSPYRSNHTVAQCSNGACAFEFWTEPKA
jgi:hypothetical protein